MFSFSVVIFVIVAFTGCGGSSDSTTSTTSNNCSLGIDNNGKDQNGLGFIGLGVLIGVEENCNIFTSSVVGIWSIYESETNATVSHQVDFKNDGSWCTSPFLTGIWDCGTTSFYGVSRDGTTIIDQDYDVTYFRKFSTEVGCLIIEDENSTMRLPMCRP